MAFRRRCSQSGLGPFFTPRTIAPGEDRAGIRGLLVEVELDRDGIGEAALHRLDRLGFQLAETGGGKIASDAAHAGAVGAVRRDGDLDHRVVEAERLGRRAADLGVRRKLDDAGMLVGELELPLRQQHAVRTRRP